LNNFFCSPVVEILFLTAASEVLQKESQDCGNDAYEHHLLVPGFKAYLLIERAHNTSQHN